MPNTHCGAPNSADRGHSGSSPSPPERYRFHQPLRSDRKPSSPAGDHSGCSTDSLVLPATLRVEVTPPARFSSAVHSSLPSHGMLGGFQAVHATPFPSGASLGDE